MRVPIRKSGLYTNIKADPNITEEKYHSLKKELEKLLNIVRPKLIDEVQTQAAFGDFSENAGYQMAKGKLRGTNQRILDIEDHLKRAIIINTKNKKERVSIGSKVTVQYLNKEKTFLILGPSETNPKENIISHVSPLGSALMGHKINEIIKTQINGKEIVYKIISIN